MKRAFCGPSIARPRRALQGLMRRGASRVVVLGGRAYSPGPHRFALLQERAHAFLAVAALQHRVAHLVDILVLGVVGIAQAAADRGLHRAQRERRVGGDPLGHRVGLGGEPLVSHHAIDQADLIRTLGASGAAVYMISAVWAGPTSAMNLRKIEVVGHAADSRRRHPQSRVLGRDAQIA